MNAFLKKEIRLLLPSFLIGCVMTVSTWLSPWRNHDAIRDILSLLPFVACPAVVVMMVLNSFGVEISSGTFTNLLAQPISRLKIWETKISLLAVALLVVDILWFGANVCVRIFFANEIPSDAASLHDLFVSEVMFGLVVFSGGLWTVLLLRQVAAAFWFTLLMPGVLMGIVVGLFADFSGDFVEGLTVIVLGLYSLTGFFLRAGCFCGRRMCNGRAARLSCRKCAGCQRGFQKQRRCVSSDHAPHCGVRNSNCIKRNSSWRLSCCCCIWA